MGQSWSKKEEVVGFLSQEELEEVKIGSCLTREEIQCVIIGVAKCHHHNIIIISTAVPCNAHCPCAMVHSGLVPVPVTWHRTLYNRFAKVDLDASDTLDVDEFLQFPEFRLNPLAYRLKELLDPKDTGVITFRAFVGVMSAFSAAALPEEKHRLAFQLYAPYYLRGRHSLPARPPAGTHSRYDPPAPQRRGHSDADYTRRLRRGCAQVRRGQRRPDQQGRPVRRTENDGRGRE
jgi:hypothetical protein